jgi:hypothetical protein
MKEQRLDGTRQDQHGLSVAVPQRHMGNIED